ncbi:MAG: capsular biosynthesis protein [Pseudomonadota bacterium]
MLKPHRDDRPIQAKATPGAHGGVHVGAPGGAPGGSADALPDGASIRAALATATAPARSPSLSPALEPTGDRPRRFLFLQGHPSRFCADLIRALRARGAVCHAINLSLGDVLFRPGIGAVAYRGRLEDWEDWLGTFLSAEAITDIVYYADQRPYHRIARRLARRRGIEVYAYEFGYLRPDWITLEKGGLGAFSHFPDRPEEIRRLAARFAMMRPAAEYPYGFLREAINEVTYHLAQFFVPVVFPRYQRDRVYHPLGEYLSYIPKLIGARLRDGHARRTIRSLQRAGTDYFVVALQMQGDYQVRRASPYRDLRTMIEEVIASFATHAPTACRLVLKMHPIENGRVDWMGIIRATAERHGVAGRVDVIDGGILKVVLSTARGLVTINSTVGLHALQAGKPVKALGIAVYDIEGLTFQGPLDAFWNTAGPPDAALLEDFTKLLMATTQVKGNFFTAAGRSAAVREVVARLMGESVNGHGAFVDPPPRLARARAAGVPILYDED